MNQSGGYTGRAGRVLASVDRKSRKSWIAWMRGGVRWGERRGCCLMRKNRSRAWWSLVWIGLGCGMGGKSLGDLWENGNVLESGL